MQFARQLPRAIERVILPKVQQITVVQFVQSELLRLD